MLGFVLGTGEGREILKEVNKFTSDIFVSTATKYGGELLKDNKIKVLNTEPLNLEGFKNAIKENDIKIFVDGTHPYASEASKTIIKACEEMNITYVRYERKSFFDKFNHKNIIRIDSYEELKEAVKDIDGTILNTTGSNNALVIHNLNLKNRIIYRVLPMWQVLKKLTEGGIEIGNIIAIKGPFSIELNRGTIKEYNIKAIITKDSGVEGSVDSKVDAILESDGKIILINKPKMEYNNVFSEITDVVFFLKDKI
ncbi:cobalt-precorrin-6A reductase [uncultured Clostridium sp.]|uniref:cobalt-precorrin-6A reductase n=1 Tax=uncultured Clostridium sp. TaxID=59620 RepID=UPI002603246A|nr:cobalt-precorrin-6A reductase [uncultured Clostridium sp.]